MLPIRFIAENLGCLVGWDDALKEVKITYPAP
jgi:Copper amine oxidase N-terminal domain.